MKVRFVVGQVKDFPTDRVRILSVGGRSIGIYRKGSRFFAVQNRCPHQLAPICKGALGGTMAPSRRGEWVYSDEGYVLRCPRHGWEFDIRTGETAFQTDRRRLLTFPVSMEDGNLVVSMEPRGHNPTTSVARP